MSRALSSLLALVLLVLAGCSSDSGVAGTPEGTDPTPVAGAPGETDGPALPPLRVLVAGDSIADGYYASTPDAAFTAVLDDRLGVDHEVTPVTVAVSGARAFRVAASVETVVAEPFDVAVLEAGTNDIGVSTPRDLAVGFRRLLAAVELSSPDATVVCLGPWDKPKTSARFESVVRRVCADHVFMPLSDLFADRDLHGPAGTSTDLGRRDWYHPNDLGHEAIAERVAQALSA